MSDTLPASGEVHASSLTFRWVHGYHSGILCGFATWQGKLCYFSLYDDADDDRKFTIHSLGGAEAETAILENEEFKARYGDHNELLPDDSYAEGICRITLEEAAAFGTAYATGKWQPAPSYEHNPIVGWFRPTNF